MAGMASTVADAAAVDTVERASFASMGRTSHAQERERERDTRAGSKVGRRRRAANGGG